MSPDEVNAWSPGECPVCGGPTRQEWIDRTEIGAATGEEWWEPGEAVCLTRERAHTEMLLEYYQI
jgi:hypothetical protein